MKKGYIKLEEAQKIDGPLYFSALTKPVGSMCNLNCAYCYYLDKERFYGEKQIVMSDEMVERYIKEYIKTNDTPEINFVWHGGEPLLAGIDYFKKVVLYQERYNTQKRVICNSIQTNATLLNEEWCRFFKENNFLVGVSIDGPKDIHNRYRYSKDGKGSFDRVIDGIELLKRYGVDFNSLSVVNNLSEGRGREIYQFLKSIGVQFMQFLPAIDYISSTELYKEKGVISSPIGDNNLENSHLAPWSVSTRGYGEFLIEIFDEWVVQDVGEIFVQIFDMTLCSWCGIEAPLCAYREVCGQSIAVEHNGDVYSCDHFVFPENRLGNIKERSLKEMIRSTDQISFGLDKRNRLSKECMRCNYYFACRGECPKHRHLDTLDGEKKFTLCEGIRLYYEHTKPFMKFMQEQLSQQRAAANVMPWARERLGALVPDKK